MTSPDDAGPYVGAPQVLAPHPNGGRTALVTVTADADRIDIARTMLDRFGGQPRSGWAMFLDLAGVRLPQVAPWLAVIAVLVAARPICRRIPRRGD